MKSNQDQVNPTRTVGSTSINDEALTGSSCGGNFVQRHDSVPGQKHRQLSLFGGFVTFAIPFVVVSILVGSCQTSVFRPLSTGSLARHCGKQTPPSEESTLEERVSIQPAIAPERRRFSDSEQGERHDFLVIQIPERLEKKSIILDDVQRYSEQTVISDDLTRDAPKLVEQDNESEHLSNDEPERTRQAIAQLNHHFQEIQKKDVRNPEKLLNLLSPLREQAKTIAERAAPQLADQAQTLLDKIQSFQNMIEDNQDFFCQLEQFDQASLDSAASRAFFAQYQTPANAEVVAPEIVAYHREFAKVAAQIDQLEVVDLWNDFIEKNGESIERFHVSQATAKAAVTFVSQNVNSAETPQEFNILTKRTPEWSFQLENVVPTQRKILLLLENEIAQKYWTFAPSVDRCYYLSAHPKPGINDYVADSSGAIKQVIIPENAREILFKESVQTSFLLELSNQARQIPDDLQDKDPAKWYADWCSFLTKIQESEQLDPILQYVLMRDCAKLLASSDYYFQRRLAPILRVLNIPALENDCIVDRFQTDTSELQKTRLLAKSRLNYLPKKHLIVDKTTAQLNAQVERIAFAYRRIGWLDRDFADEWKCRRPADAKLPEGDLYIILPPDDSQTSRWLKIGSSNGKRTNLQLATNNIPRGSIIFCRVSLKQEKNVVKRASVETIFNR